LDKAPDAFRTISEVADDLDIPQHVLRFWETRFAQIKPMKRSGGRRYYRPDDVDLLRGIRRLLYGEGYTIRGVQRILKEHGIKSVQALMDDTSAVPSFAMIDSALNEALHEPEEEGSDEPDLDAEDEDEEPIEAAPVRRAPEIAMPSPPRGWKLPLASASSIPRSWKPCCRICSPAGNCSIPRSRTAKARVLIATTPWDHGPGCLLLKNAPSVPGNRTAFGYGSIPPIGPSSRSRFLRTGLIEANGTASERGAARLAH
jgi:DNA-binding transcriptional MerR regulator